MRVATREKTRYRTEDGEPCIDIAVPSIHHLLDTRDPARFRERDLDSDLVEYLFEAAEDLWAAKRVRVVFWLKEPCALSEIETAYRAHFTSALQQLARRNRERLRTGFSALAVAACMVVVLFALSQLMQATLKGTIGTALTEGVVILMWIVLWRPADVLLYDWIPVRRERALVRRLLDAHVALREGHVVPVRHVGDHGAKSAFAVKRPLSPLSVR